MRDNQPKHRQLNRERTKLARHKASRQGLPVFLIVCEGKETEPNYIQGLCEENRINLASVHIVRGRGDTDAVSLVKRAQMLFGKDKDFDRVFVVLDDDGYQLDPAQKLAAKRLKTASGKIINVELIASNPCFEFWLLLHFEFTSRPFVSAKAIEALRVHLTNYEKADRRIFLQVASGLDMAMANARRLKRELATGGARSPSVEMHLLVNELLTMRP